MNKSFKILLFVIIAVFSGSISMFAQDEIDLRTSEFFEAPLIGRSYTAPPVGKGSPYLYENWLKGYVVFSTGDTIKNKLFKFDCYKNEFIWMSDGKSLIALDNHLITAFGLYPKTGPVRKFEKTSLKIPFLTDTMVRYLEVLAQGKMNLFAYRNVTVFTESTIGNKGGLYQLSSYEPEPYYYIQIGDLPVKQVRFYKKSLIDSYKEYSATLKKILKENHYGRIQNEFQLVNAVNVINSNWRE